jgi:hypothetical protein
LEFLALTPGVTEKDATLPQMVREAKPIVIGATIANERTAEKYISRVK